jgi:hypothetical protein
VKRYPHAVLPDEVPNRFEFSFEVRLPRKIIDFVRAKWHDIGAHSEEKQAVLHVPFQYFTQASEVSSYGLDQPLGRVRSQPKSACRTAWQRFIDARIPNFHILLAYGRRRVGVRQLAIIDEQLPQVNGPGYS